MRPLCHIDNAPTILFNTFILISLALELSRHSPMTLELISISNLTCTLHSKTWIRWALKHNTLISASWFCWSFLFSPPSPTSLPSELDFLFSAPLHLYKSFHARLNYCLLSAAFLFYTSCQPSQSTQQHTQFSSCSLTHNYMPFYCRALCV